MNKGRGRLQFIGGAEFWNMYLAYRIVWVYGRYGGGKTSLAVILLARLMAEGYIDHVWSNIPLTFSTTPGKPYEHVGMLLDEAWLYMETRRDVSDYAAFVRKFEHWLALPGIFPVHARMSFFRVQRTFNAYTLGAPFWAYKWRIKMGDIREEGSFWIWNPKAVFGHYPTKYVPGTDGGISDVVLEASKEAGFVGSRAEQKARELATKFSISEGESNPSQLDDIVSRLDDEAFQFAETADSIEESRRKAQKARGFR